MHFRKETVNRLPDPTPTPDMKILGETIDHLKTTFLTEDSHPSLLPPDFIKHIEIINIRLHTVTSHLLRPSFHPEIVSNVLLGLGCGS